MVFTRVYILSTCCKTKRATHVKIEMSPAQHSKVQHTKMQSVKIPTSHEDLNVVATGPKSIPQQPLPSVSPKLTQAVGRCSGGC